MAIVTERFVRKPIYVDAIQVTPENFLELAFWCSGSIQNNDGSNTDKGGRTIDPSSQHIYIRSTRAANERQTQARVGDWILKNEHGTFKIYTNKAFKNHFDPESKTIINDGRKAAEEVRMEHEDTQAQDEQMEQVQRTETERTETETVTPAEPTDGGAADSQQEPQQDSALQTPQADQPVPTPDPVEEKQGYTPPPQPDGGQTYA